MSEWLNHLLEVYGFYVVFGVIALEAMGLPLPAESMLIGASVYAATTGRLSIYLIIAAAAAGAIMGDNFGYLIGRWAGFPLLKHYGRYVGLNDRRLTLGRYLFKKHGGKVVFVGRFVAILRTFVALMAGASHMEWKTFLLWNAVGGVLWTASYSMAAYLLGDAIYQLKHGPLDIVGAVAAVILIGGSIFYLRRNEKRLEDNAVAAMKGDDTAPAE